MLKTTTATSAAPRQVTVADGSTTAPAGHTPPAAPRHVEASRPPATMNSAPPTPPSAEPGPPRTVDRLSVSLGARIAELQGAAQRARAAAEALRKTPEDASARAAFESAAAIFDAAKRATLAELPRSTATQRQELARALVGSVEAAHGKPGTTERLLVHLPRLAASPETRAVLREVFGLDDAGVERAIAQALEAAAWVSLGEAAPGSPSRVLGFPGRLSDEDRRQYVAPLTDRTADVVRDARLAEPTIERVLREHQRAPADAAAALLGYARQVSALSQRRDQRGPFGPEQIRSELERNIELGSLHAAFGDPRLASAIRAAVAPPE